MKWLNAYFDYDLGRARLSSGRFISNRAARGIALMEDVDEGYLSRYSTAARTLADDYGGSEDDARIRIAEWLARREEGAEDDENPFPSP